MPGAAHVDVADEAGQRALSDRVDAGDLYGAQRLRILERDGHGGACRRLELELVAIPAVNVEVRLAVGAGVPGDPSA